MCNLILILISIFIGIGVIVLVVVPFYAILDLLIRQNTSYCKYRVVRHSWFFHFCELIVGEERMKKYETR